MALIDLDPYGNYYFALEINGVEVAHFTECSGLKTSTQIFEFEEGGLNGRTHKRVGQSKWENIVLRYATSASTFMLQWRDHFLQDKFVDGYKFHDGKPVSGSITMKNNMGIVVRRFSFDHAWPVSWEGPSFNSGGSELAIETLEIAHNGLKIANE
jgi:phage tail-like protein